MKDLRTEQTLDAGAVAHEMSKTFMSHVFSYMAAALVITGVIAYVFGSDPQNMRFMFNQGGGMNMLGWIVMLAPLGFVLAMGGLMKRISSPLMLVLFVAYSAIMGISMSFIFLVYTASSITTTFFICAGMFSVMAVAGWTTSTDLTKFGSLLGMAVVGLIIAMVINWFMNSEMMDYVISIFGVLIFTGLTAYDVQKLKRIGSGIEIATEEGTKLAIWGAVSLYLDFVNLFLFLLRIFGNRN